MTNDPQHKLIFENWRGFMKEEVKTPEDEKQEFLNFIEDNKVNFTAEKAISYLKKNYDNFAILKKDQVDKLSSFIDSVLPSSMTYAEEERVAALASSIIGKVDELYSANIYTDSPHKTQKELDAFRAKAQEKFALGHATLTKGEFAAVTAALGAGVVGAAAAKVGIIAAGGWFANKIKNIFGFGKKASPDLTEKFGTGADGGEKAAAAIAGAGGDRALKWAGMKQLGKRSLVFLGGAGVVGATVWLLKDLYDSYYKENPGSVNETSKEKFNKEEIENKILQDIEKLKTHEAFWKALTTSIGKQINAIAKKEKETQKHISTANIVVSGDETERADALWPMVKRLAGGGAHAKLVMGIIHSENRFQNISNNWGSGYMALTSIARKDVSQRGGLAINYKNRMNPELNIKAGIALLKLIEKDLRRALRRRVNFDVPESEIPRLILYSYNRGVGAVVDGKGVPIGSSGKGKKYKHAGSKVFERGLKRFSDIDSFISYARKRYSKVLHGDYADRALGFARSYTPPGDASPAIAENKTIKIRKKRS